MAYMSVLVNETAAVVVLTVATVVDTHDDSVDTVD